MTVIRLQHVNKSYGQTRAVIDLDLTIPHSAIAVLLGRSGVPGITGIKESEIIRHTNGLLAKPLSD